MNEDKPLDKIIDDMRLGDILRDAKCEFMDSCPMSQRFNRCYDKLECEYYQRFLKDGGLYEE